MPSLAGLFTGHDPTRVGSRGFQNLAGRVRSGQNLNTSRAGSGRVKRFQNLAGRVESGRVNRLQNLAGRVGSGHDPRDTGHSRVKPS